MLKLALDISTTATGIIIQKNNQPLQEYKLFLANEKDPMIRIKTMARQIIKWLENKKFDIMIITKATHQFSSQNILFLEGVILGESIRRNIKFDYFPDVAWYSKIGFVNDDRNQKKRVSIERLCKRNNWVIVKKNEKMLGHKISKIIVKTVDHKIFTDDIADAFNASDLYEKRLHDYKVKKFKEKVQQVINNFSSQNKKLRNQIIIKNQQFKQTVLEQSIFRKQLETFETKRTTNSLNIRSNRLTQIKNEIIERQNKIEDNKKSINKLRAKWK